MESLAQKVTRGLVENELTTFTPISIKFNQHDYREKLDYLDYKVIRAKW